MTVRILHRLLNDSCSTGTTVHRTSGVLLYHGHPVSYLSPEFGQKLNYSGSDIEMLAVICANVYHNMTSMSSSSSSAKQRYASCTATNVQLRSGLPSVLTNSTYGRLSSQCDRATEICATHGARNDHRCASNSLRTHRLFCMARCKAR